MKLDINVQIYYLHLYFSGSIPENQHHCRDPSSCDRAACSVGFSWLTIVLYAAACCPVAWCDRKSRTHALTAARSHDAHHGRSIAVSQGGGGVKALNTVCSTKCKKRVVFSPRKFFFFYNSLSERWSRGAVFQSFIELKKRKNLLLIITLIMVDKGNNPFFHLIEYLLTKDVNTWRGHLCH